MLMFRYEPQTEGMDESRKKQELEKINTELLKKLEELDTDIVFSTGLSSTDLYCTPEAFQQCHLHFAPVLILSCQVLSSAVRSTVFSLAW